MPPNMQRARRLTDVHPSDVSAVGLWFPARMLPVAPRYFPTAIGFAGTA